MPRYSGDLRRRLSEPTVAVKVELVAYDHVGQFWRVHHVTQASDRGTYTFHRVRGGDYLLRARGTVIGLLHVTSDPQSAAPLLALRMP